MWEERAEGSITGATAMNFDALNEAQRHWGIHFDEVDSKTKEYRSTAGCPFCGDSGKGHKSDRFRLFLDSKPRYWCRRCNVRGFIDSLGEHTPMTPEQKIEIRLKELERKQQEQERRLSALERMARCTDHLQYHSALQVHGREYWYEEGIYDETIDKFTLGYCERCPTDSKGSPSHTIPVINSGKLENIRHRLVTPNGGKYRPHIAGLGLQLFNADALNDTERIIVTEGEKKAIVLDQSRFPTVAILGKGAYNERKFKSEWLDLFSGVKHVIIALDPDAMDSAHRLARIFDSRGRVAHLPMKIDDMIVHYGASSADIEYYLSLASPAGAQ